MTLENELTGILWCVHTYPAQKSVQWVYKLCIVIISINIFFVFILSTHAHPFNHFLGMNKFYVVLDCMRLGILRLCSTQTLCQTIKPQVNKGVNHMKVTRCK